MSVKNENVGVAVTGAVYRGQSGATAPTGTASAVTTNWDEMGWISEDGISRAMPGAGDAETTKGWQGGATVRVIRTPSEDNPTFSFQMLETKKEVVEATYGTAVTQTAAEGSYTINTNTVRTKDKWVIDVVDGAELTRYYIPQGEVTEIGEQALTSNGATVYEVTLECHLDSTVGGQIKVWETRLKTAA